MAVLTAVASGAVRDAGTRRGGRPVLLLLPAIAVLLIMFVLPVGIIVWRSVTDPQTGFGNYTWIFSSDTATGSLIRTFGIAALVTGITLALAYPYAYLMLVSGPRARAALILIALLPFWTSLMVRTFAWMILLQDNGIVAALTGQSFLGTTAGVVIGMTQVLLPFMVLPLYATMTAVDTRLVPAAQTLGASPLKAFAQVFVPLTLPGVAAGCLTVFITALGFYVTPALLGSPQDAMISQQIFTQVNGLLQWGRGGALGTVLLVLTLALLGIAALILRYSPLRGGGGRT
jgi:putative spermidine/putrescine transport system permease protein